MGISLSAYQGTLAASGLWCTQNCDGQQPAYQAFVKIWSVVSGGGQYRWSSPARLHDDEPRSDFGRAIQLGEELLVVGAPLSAYYDQYPQDGIDRPGIVYLFKPNPLCITDPCPWISAGIMQEENTLGYGQALSLGPTYLSVSRTFLWGLNSHAVLLISLIKFIEAF